MEDYASRQRHPRQHGLGIALVVVLHVLFFWAIQSGLMQTVTQKAQVVVDAVLLTSPTAHREAETAKAHRG